jgi:hypothetical protein
VECIALYKSEQHDVDAEWPGIKAEHPYWKLAVDYIVKETGAADRSGKSWQTMID